MQHYGVVGSFLSNPSIIWYMIHIQESWHDIFVIIAHPKLQLLFLGFLSSVFRFTMEPLLAVPLDREASFAASSHTSLFVLPFACSFCVTMCWTAMQQMPYLECGRKRVSVESTSTCRLRKRPVDLNQGAMETGWIGVCAGSSGWSTWRGSDPRGNMAFIITDTFWLFQITDDGRVNGPWSQTAERFKKKKAKRKMFFFLISPEAAILLADFLLHATCDRPVEMNV